MVVVLMCLLHLSLHKRDGLGVIKIGLSGVAIRSAVGIEPAGLGHVGWVLNELLDQIIVVLVVVTVNFVVGLGVLSHGLGFLVGSC